MTSSAMYDYSFLLDLNIPFKTNYPLSEFTTFRLGGYAPCVITCAQPQELVDVIKALRQRQIDFILFGGGSNLLVSDEGVHCAVVRYVSETPIIKREGLNVTVSGSTILDQLVMFAVENSLEGINYASGIPGTVGGAVVGNAGAFGKQVGDYIKSVTLLSENAEVSEVDPKFLDFRYRYSKLKSGNDVVLSVCFQMQPSKQEILKKECEEILNLRLQKHPSLTAYPCAGSFFRNIEPTSSAGRRQAAGWFLEESGAKNMSAGDAKIFEKHANIIVKTGQASAQDVFELSKKMAAAVKHKFNLDLEREVRLVGKFKGMPAEVSQIIW